MTFPAGQIQDEQTLTNQFPYEAPSPPLDETLAYTAFSNQTNTSYNNEVKIILILFHYINDIIKIIFTL